jgi:hypothetical protein
VLEKKIEQKGSEYARKKGVLHLKFTSPARAAVPDRLLLAPVPEFLRPLVAQYVRFVEYKRTGQTPTPAQTREHLRLRGLGFQVDVVDNVIDAERVIGEMNVNP